VSLLNIKREFFHEELSKRTHDFCHLDSHYFARAFDFSYRVAGSEAGERSIVDINGTECSELV
jgi:hypothetical protein